MAGYFDFNGGDLANAMQGISQGTLGTGNAPAYLDPSALAAYGISPQQTQLMGAAANANRQAAYAQASQPVVGKWGGGGPLPTGDIAQAAGGKAYYDTLMGAPKTMQDQTLGGLDIAQKSLGLQWASMLQNEKVKQLLGQSPNMGRYLDLGFGRATSNDPDELYAASQALSLTFPEQAKGLAEKAKGLKEGQLKIGEGLDTSGGPALVPQPSAAATPLRGAGLPAPTQGEASDADTSGGVDIPRQPGGSPNQPDGQLAYRNSNPGNLTYAGQPGATKGEGGYAKFPTPEAGAAALTAQIKNDAMRGLTFGQYAAKYAPDDPNYAAKLQTILGAKVDPNTPLRSIDPQVLTAAQARVESGTKVTQAAADTTDYNKPIPILPPSRTGNPSIDFEQDKAWRLENTKPPNWVSYMDRNNAGKTIDVDVQHFRPPENFVKNDAATLPPNLAADKKAIADTIENGGQKINDAASQLNLAEMTQNVLRDSAFKSGGTSELTMELRSRLANILPADEVKTLNLQQTAAKLSVMMAMEARKAVSVPGVLNKTEFTKLEEFGTDLGDTVQANRARVAMFSDVLKRAYDYQSEKHAAVVSGTAPSQFDAQWNADGRNRVSEADTARYRNIVATQPSDFKFPTGLSGDALAKWVDATMPDLTPEQRPWFKQAYGAWKGKK